jgi:hypothetical protein
MLPRRESYDKIFLTTGAFPLLLIPAVEFILQIPPDAPTGSIFSHQYRWQIEISSMISLLPQRVFDVSVKF